MNEIPESDEGYDRLPADETAGRSALDALIDSVPDALALLSIRGRIMRVNEAATHLLGIAGDDLVGRSITGSEIGLGVDDRRLLDALSTPDAVSYTSDLSGGRKAMVTIRRWCGADQRPRYLILVARDVTGITELLTNLRTAVPARRTRWQQMRGSDVGIDEIVIESPAMRAVAERALQFAEVDSPVLIVGETGTGKTLFSRIIHEASSRASAPLREVNCAAIPAGLIESELFGYARGAFTGADARGRTGLIELANEGTLLLDEIGDMPLSLQVKLLQFLEGGEVWPVGASKPKRVDVRVIAATNADLTELVAQGSFRRDLFYRLNVLELHVPPLREHPEDIAPLVTMMASTLKKRIGKLLTITPEAFDVLARHPFPGNIRELWNIVERLAVSCRSGHVDVQDLPQDVTQSVLSPRAPEGLTNLRHLLKKVEAAIVRDALQRYGTQTRAAKHLGVGQATIARKARLLDASDLPPSSASG